MSLVQIDDLIWIGDVDTPTDAPGEGIEAILNVAENVNDTVPANTQYAKVGLYDTTGNTCIMLTAAVDALDNFVSQGLKTAVHCFAGQNRGPGVVALYYHRFKGWPLQSAWNFILSKKADISHQQAFWDTMLACEGLADVGDCANSIICCPDADFPVGAILPPGPTPQPPPPPPPPPVYWNTEQCYTAPCPVVGNNTVCVAADTFWSQVSQADADALALADATARALAGENCGNQASLSGLRWEMPCIFQPPGGPVCSCADPADQNVQLNADAGTIWTVTLLIRGEVELKNYIGGTLQPGTSDYCMKDGTVDPAYNPGANEYSLIVSDPASVYWLNHIPAGYDPAVDPSKTHLLNYQIDVPVRGGAIVTLRAQAKDAQQVPNGGFTLGGVPITAIVVPGVPPDPTAYNGQFIQMDCLGIV